MKKINKQVDVCFDQNVSGMSAAVLQHHSEKETNLQRRCCVELWFAMLHIGTVAGVDVCFDQNVSGMTAAVLQHHSFNAADDWSLSHCALPPSSAVFLVSF